MEYLELAREWFEIAFDEAIDKGLSLKEAFLEAAHLIQDLFGFEVAKAVTAG
jgi:hypothetical protein